jgi:hypothetical protein
MLLLPSKDITEVLCMLLMVSRGKEDIIKIHKTKR